MSFRYLLGIYFITKVKTQFYVGQKEFRKKGLKGVYRLKVEYGKIMRNIVLTFHNSFEREQAY